VPSPPEKILVGVTRKLKFLSGVGEEWEMESGRKGERGKGRDTTL